MTHRVVFGTFVASISIIIVLTIANFSNAEMVGAWTFEGDSEEIVEDISGHGNDGEIFGEAERVEGKYGQGLRFDGVDDYVNLGNDLSLNPPTDMSIVTWLFVEEVANTWNMIVVKWGPGMQSYHLALSQGVLRMHVHGGEKFMAMGKDPVPIGEWIHVATTVDSATEKIIIYMNGSEVGSLEYSGFLTKTPNPAAMGVKLDDKEQVLHSYFFSGIMDEVAIFDGALTLDEIKKIMGGLEAFMPVHQKSYLTTTWASIKAQD